MPEEKKIPKSPEQVADVNLESAFSDLFKSSTSGTGEEELLRIASTYSRQITSEQIKCLLFLKVRAETLAEKPRKILEKFVDGWLELKQFNNSDMFVMKALEFISLRKFLNENTFKVNVEK